MRTAYGDNVDTIRYFYKKPGKIRMEFMEPHAGTVLVYDPAKKAVTLRPFASERELNLTLGPGASLVKGPLGHRVDESDIGVMITRARLLMEHGQARVLGEENIGGRRTTILEVESGQGFSLAGTTRWLISLDEKNWLPLRIMAYGESGNLIEDLRMDDLELDVQMDDSLFRP
ncbi:sigma-E factor regulatory protein RseB domain-containing protein [Fundidesulfovibrio terrae]|uniref:sigma-E factor regulatory protein RseB domain-containing protein n=1 Tax=Fundidesulfovibrio terrae TaxID=2922866 RepID=UPI001FAF417D|nr:sigma-E factor regulatory protein RseB domain-containing protein [Fundidesulfovibrio terrae]